MAKTLKLPRPGTRTRAVFEALYNYDGVGLRRSQLKGVYDMAPPALGAHSRKYSSMSLTPILRKFTVRDGPSYKLAPAWRMLRNAENDRPLAHLAAVEEKIKAPQYRRTSLRAAELRPGDRIICTDPTDYAGLKLGETYTVAGADGTDGDDIITTVEPIWLSNAPGARLEVGGVLAGRFERAAAPVAKKSFEFKPGDVVRAKERLYNLGMFTPKGTVKHVRGYNRLGNVVFTENSNGGPLERDDGWFPSKWELVPQNERSVPRKCGVEGCGCAGEPERLVRSALKFRAGDRVRVKSGWASKGLIEKSEHVVKRLDGDLLYFEDGPTGWDVIRFEHAQPAAASPAERVWRSTGPGGACSCGYHTWSQGNPAEYWRDGYGAPGQLHFLDGRPCQRQPPPKPADGSSRPALDRNDARNMARDLRTAVELLNKHLERYNWMTTIAKQAVVSARDMVAAQAKKLEDRS